MTDTQLVHLGIQPPAGLQVCRGEQGRHVASGSRDGSAAGGSRLPGLGWSRLGDRLWPLSFALLPACGEQGRSWRSPACSRVRSGLPRRAPPAPTAARFSGHFAACSTPQAAGCRRSFWGRSGRSGQARPGMTAHLGLLQSICKPDRRWSQPQAAAANTLGPPGAALARARPQWRSVASARPFEPGGGPAAACGQLAAAASCCLWTCLPAAALLIARASLPSLCYRSGAAPVCSSDSECCMPVALLHSL